MILTDLPLELFQSVLDETVRLVGIRNAVPLRLVSSNSSSVSPSHAINYISDLEIEAFDTQIQRAIYLLPIFENYDYASQPFPLQLPRVMHPAMKTRLILLKYDTGNVSRRPLFQAMDRALTYLESHTNYVKGDARAQRPFIEALAAAAARNLRMYDLSVCLITDVAAWLAKVEERRALDAEYRRRLRGNRDWPRVTVEYIATESSVYVDCVAQDALVAAMAAGRTDLADKLLKGGVSAIKSSQAFGIPVRVAARMGLEGTVNTALREISAQSERESEDEEDPLQKARWYVVKGAVAGGHEALIRTTLEELERGGVWNRKGISGMIKSAVEDKNESIALILLGKRVPLPKRKVLKFSGHRLEEKEAHFWYHLAKSAKECGFEGVLRVALESAVVGPYAMFEL